MRYVSGMGDEIQMERKSKDEELPVDRFEDAYDMLDHVYEELDHAIYLWVIWAKAFGSSEEQDALKAVLSEIVIQEYDSLFKRMTVEISPDKNGTPRLNAVLSKYF